MQPDGDRDFLIWSLEIKDQILIREVLNRLNEEPTPRVFLEIINKVIEYFYSSEFLDDYAHLLKSVGENPKFPWNEESTNRIKVFPPCMAARNMVLILMQNPVFKKLWTIVNAFKIQASFEGFEAQINKKDFTNTNTVDQYIDDCIVILDSELENLRKFTINPSSDPTNIIYVTENDIYNLGIFVVAKESGILMFNRDLAPKAFLGKGVSTFGTELKKVIKHAIAHKKDIESFVETQLKKNGLISKLMRIELISFSRNFSPEEKGDMTYEETLEGLKRYGLDPGLCPAALPMENTNLSIVEVMTYIIVANIPDRLK